MDMNVTQGVGVPKTPYVADKKADGPKEEKPQAPVDKVEQGHDEAGFVHKSFRGIAKIVGGAVGSVPGAFTGGVKGAATEEPHEILAPREMKALRATAATGVTIITAMAGLMAGGIPGLVIGLVGGPILGSGLSEALPGFLDGAYAATKGAAKGAWEGMKKGAGVGGRFVDWVASKIPNEKPAEGPKPPDEPPKPQA